MFPKYIKIDSEDNIQIPEYLNSTRELGSIICDSCDNIIATPDIQTVSDQSVSDPDHHKYNLNGQL